jgi:hypothetical protein
LLPKILCSVKKPIIKYIIKKKKTQHILIVISWLTVKLIIRILLPIFKLFKKLVAPKRPQLIFRSNMIRRRTQLSSMFYGANLHVNSMNVYMCDRHWQYSCLRHMKWALKWTILLTSILEPNFDIYSLVSLVTLMDIATNIQII